MADIVGKAMEFADSWASKQATPPSDEAWESQYEKRLQRLKDAQEADSFNTPQGRQLAQIEAHKKSVAATETALQKVRESNDPPGVKATKERVLQEIIRLKNKYEPQKRPGFVEKRILALQNYYGQLASAQFETSANAVTPATPATSEPQVHQYGRKLGPDIRNKAVEVGLDAWSAARGAGSTIDRAVNRVGNFMDYINPFGD